MKARLVFALALTTTACAGSSPTAPTTPPAAPACTTNQTADVIFQNASPLGVTYDVFLGNAKMGALSPGQSSPPQTLAAGVNHQIDFRYTNTIRTACSMTLAFPACSQRTVNCTN